MLGLLSETVSKQVFHKALQQNAANCREAGASWENFTAIISKACGHSLDWFFRRWFEQTGVPEWETEWEQRQNSLSVKITQMGYCYRLPLDLLITYENGASFLEKTEIGERRSSIKIPATGKVRSVKTDPYFNIVHWDEEMKPAAIVLGKISAVQKLRLEQQYGTADRLALACIGSLPASDTYGVEYSFLCVLE